VTSVIDRDYPLVMGMTLTYGMILILCNLMVDLTYGIIDPRVRLENVK
jgi:oligopeptide transport system permease protein